MKSKIFLLALVCALLTTVTSFGQPEGYPLTGDIPGNLRAMVKPIGIVKVGFHNGKITYARETYATGVVQTWLDDYSYFHWQKDSSGKDGTVFTKYLIFKFSNWRFTLYDEYEWLTAKEPSSPKVPSPQIRDLTEKMALERSYASMVSGNSGYVTYRTDGGHTTTTRSNDGSYVHDSYQDSKGVQKDIYHYGHPDGTTTVVTVETDKDGNKTRNGVPVDKSQRGDKDRGGNGGGQAGGNGSGNSGGNSSAGGEGGPSSAIDRTINNNWGNR